MKALQNWTLNLNNYALTDCCDFLYRHMGRDQRSQPLLALQIFSVKIIFSADTQFMMGELGGLAPSRPHAT